MINVRSIGLAAVLLAASVGCSNGSGLFGHDYPDGNIVIRDAVTGQVLTTSHDSPFIVDLLTLRFPITVEEGRFNGPFTVTFLKQENVPTAANGGNAYPYSFNQPCFVAHNGNDTSQHRNLITFLGDNANGKPANFPLPLTAAEFQANAPGNPCHSGELESVQISDQKGHFVFFYYEEV